MSSSSTSSSSSLQGLVESVNAFETMVRRIQEMVEKLGTSRDTEQVRKQTSSLLREAKVATQSLKEQFRRVRRPPAGMSADAALYRRLQQQFTVLGGQVDRLSQEAVMRERQVLSDEKRTLETTTSSARGGSPNEDDVNERTSLLGSKVGNRAATAGRRGKRTDGDQMESSYQGDGIDFSRTLQQRQEVMLVDNGVAVYDVEALSAIVEERDRDIMEIEAAARDVHEIMRDMATMVHDQGSQITTFSDNISHANVHTRAAVKEVNLALEYQKKSRKKLCCMLLIAVVAAGILAGIFVGIFH